MDSNKVEIFPYDKKVTIEINGAFYSRLHQLMIDYAQLTDSNTVISLLQELKDREPKNANEAHFLTLITLLSTIENNARIAGLLELKDLPPNIAEEQPQS